MGGYTTPFPRARRRSEARARQGPPRRGLPGHRPRGGLRRGPGRGAASAAAGRHLHPGGGGHLLSGRDHRGAGAAPELALGQHHQRDQPHAEAHRRQQRQDVERDPPVPAVFLHLLRHRPPGDRDQLAGNQRAGVPLHGGEGGPRHRRGERGGERAGRRRHRRQCRRQLVRRRDLEPEHQQEPQPDARPGRPQGGHAGADLERGDGSGRSLLRGRVGELPAAAGGERGRRAQRQLFGDVGAAAADGLYAERVHGDDHGVVWQRVGAAELHAAGDGRLQPHGRPDLQPGGERRRGDRVDLDHVEPRRGQDLRQGRAVRDQRHDHREGGLDAPAHDGPPVEGVPEHPDREQHPPGVQPLLFHLGLQPLGQARFQLRGAGGRLGRRRHLLPDEPDGRRQGRRPPIPPHRSRH